MTGRRIRKGRESNETKTTINAANTIALTGGAATLLDVQGTGTAAITANKVNGNIVLGNDSAKVNLTLTGADTSWAGNSSGGSTTDFTKGTHVNLNGGTWKSTLHGSGMQASAAASDKMPPKACFF